MAARELLQVEGQFSRQNSLLAGVVFLSCGRSHSRHLVWSKTGRGVEASQILLPVSCGRREVLPLQPGDVITVRSGRLRMQWTVLNYRSVKIKNFFENDRKGPSIQQQMMVTPDKLI